MPKYIVSVLITNTPREKELTIYAADEAEAELTPDTVRAVRHLVGTVSQREIAKRFGVCQMTISHISSGRTWSWLA